MTRTTRRVLALVTWHIASGLARLMGCGPISVQPCCTHELRVVRQSMLRTAERGLQPLLVDWLTIQEERLASSPEYLN
jgi:hypothetical protein